MRLIRRRRARQVLSCMKLAPYSGWNKNFSKFNAQQFRLTNGGEIIDDRSVTYNCGHKRGLLRVPSDRSAWECRARQERR